MVTKKTTKAKRLSRLFVSKMKIENAKRPMNRTRVHFYAAANGAQSDFKTLVGCLIGCTCKRRYNAI